MYLVLALGALFRPRLFSERVWQRIVSILSGLALLYLGLWVMLVAVQFIAPQRSGVFALLQVLGPYLLVPACVFVPLTFARGTYLLRWALVLATVIFLVRCPPALPLRAPTALASAPQIRVMNWNLQINPLGNQVARLRPLLAAQPADVIVFQEAYWSWLDQDLKIKAAYPYQLANTEFASSGPVILSKYPFLANGVAETPPNTRGWPRLLWARLDLGTGSSVLVVAAHPESPYTSNRNDCRPPWCYDTAQRDSLIPLARAIIDPALARNEAVILAGDLNTTDREPQLNEWGLGLRDAHEQAGWGWGLTWGLHYDESDEDYTGRYFVPLLRFDHIMSSPALIPLSASTDCSRRGSDHCIVYSTFAVNGTATTP